MIARLCGILEEKSPERIVLDVKGVGYDLRVPLSTYGALPELGAEVRLLVHTHVRDDAISLFGFASHRERFLFEKMIGVSGIGPRLAIALLSGLPPGELVEAIRSGEAARLCRIPGVGKKTAERLVVDLRDKLDAVAGEGPEASGHPPREGKGGESGVLEDVLSALVNLGYPARAAERAVADARTLSTVEKGSTFTFERLLRDALRHVSPSR
jgi:holliday junction DNA helicase RuvA